MQNKIGFLTLLVLVLWSLWLAGDAILLVQRPYTQEYVPGQGNIKGDVDADKFLAIDERFAIGADADGWAVFKDPRAAFQALRERYAKGIAEIQREYHLLPLTLNHYKLYGIYGWQTTPGSEEARFVSGFLDIYENSFRK